MSRPDPVRVHLFEGTRLRANLPLIGVSPDQSYEIDGVRYRTTDWLPVTHHDGTEGLDVQIELEPSPAG